MTSGTRPIELLAPAKNLECGMAAIDHGADAVYIGADNFGARAAAGNSLDEIAQLCNYAHIFGAKVYVTVNTIVYENELQEAEELIDSLTRIKVDAILVQDMAIVKLMGERHGNKFPELHASTQTDNRNIEKVKWLRSIGFRRVVLARELSLKEISDIHKAVPDVELEAFVHGALCVSYSGACYASLHCFKRSANRGECAQFCRLSFDLLDSDNKMIEHDRHLLSLKDLNQFDVMEDLLNAGVSSLKIEGRLKNVDYVKNVVAAYSIQLNKIISIHPDKYRRASYGKVSYDFKPNLNKTFNRGFTHYFLNGRTHDIESFDTPKAMGEYVGYVKEIKGNSFNVAGTAIFANGDGLCFITKDHKLEGFRVNRVENNRLFPLTMPRNLCAGMALYRNNDQNFERILSHKTADRRMFVDFTLNIAYGKLIATAVDEAGRKAETVLDADLQEALKPQRENIIRQMEKLGNTPFALRNINLDDDVCTKFIPSSKLAELRRELVRLLTETRISGANNTYQQKQSDKTDNIANDARDINTANVANSLSQEFYKEHGIDNAPKAHELEYVGNSPQIIAKGIKPIMTCRFCLKYALGHCVKRGGTQATWKEPLFLQLPDEKKFRLAFNCNKCQMEIYAKN